MEPYYIKSVKIDGLWGKGSFTIKLSNEVNIFIGVNGTGKTTIINIISAALQLEFSSLDRLPFSKVIITLTKKGVVNNPVIEIKKSRGKFSSFEKILFSIKNKATEKSKFHSLDDFEEEKYIRRNLFHEYLQSKKQDRRLPLLHSSKAIVNQAKRLTNVSWLSIHRSPETRISEREYSFESTIDQKLEDLSNDIVRFLSLLQRKASEEIQQFQKKIFSSILNTENPTDVQKQVAEFDFNSEKKSLLEIYKTFGVSSSTTTEQINLLYSKTEHIVSEKYSEGAQNVMPIDDFITLLNSHRLHLLVQEWNDLNARQSVIFKVKDVFTNIINGMLQGKKLEYGDDNQIRISSNIGSIPLRHLSSGEKQLLIILGTALLQNNRPWIYIADEPELSLHMKWQEKMIRNIKLKLLKNNPPALNSHDFSHSRSPVRSSSALSWTF